MDEQFWNDLYGTGEKLWSGEPNGLLVTEVAGMPPGRALDLGCGEGADALWLAGKGWQVTGIDISRVALDRAAAADPAGTVKWIHADLTLDPPPPAAFDLVSAMYCAVPRDPDQRALRGVLAAVAPGGTLLLGHHDLTDWHDHHPDYDPNAFYTHDEVAELLDDGWVVETNETRPRVSPAPPDTHHVNDTLLRARRTP